MTRRDATNSGWTTLRDAWDALRNRIESFHSGESELVMSMEAVENAMLGEEANYDSAKGEYSRGHLDGWNEAERLIKDSALSETAPLVAGDLAKQREIHDTYAPVSATVRKPEESAWWKDQPIEEKLRLMTQCRDSAVSTQKGLWEDAFRWRAMKTDGLVDIRIDGQEFIGISDLNAWIDARRDGR